MLSLNVISIRASGVTPAAPCSGEMEATCGATLSTHVPRRHPRPGAQSESVQQASSAMQEPSHARESSLHEKPQRPSSHVADPFAGAGQGVQVLPQLEIDASETHSPSHSCSPSGHGATSSESSRTHSPLRSVSPGSHSVAHASEQLVLSSSDAVPLPVLSSMAEEVVVVSNTSVVPPLVDVSDVVSFPVSDAEVVGPLGEKHDARGSKVHRRDEKRCIFEKGGQKHVGRSTGSPAMVREVRRS